MYIALVEQIDQCGIRGVIVYLSVAAWRLPIRHALFLMAYDTSPDTSHLLCSTNHNKSQLITRITSTATIKQNKF